MYKYVSGKPSAKLVNNSKQFPGHGRDSVSSPRGVGSTLAYPHDLAFVTSHHLFLSRTIWSGNLAREL